MLELTAVEARKEFSSVVDAAYVKAQRVVIVRNGRRVAAIVPMADLEQLERLEDEADAAEVNKALADVASGREKTIPWEQVKRELGLK